MLTEARTKSIASLLRLRPKQTRSLQPTTMWVVVNLFGKMRRLPGLILGDAGNLLSAISGVGSSHSRSANLVGAVDALMNGPNQHQVT